MNPLPIPYPRGETGFEEGGLNGYDRWFAVRVRDPDPNRLPGPGSSADREHRTRSWRKLPALQVTVSGKRKPKMWIFSFPDPAR